MFDYFVDEKLCAMVPWAACVPPPPPPPPPGSHFGSVFVPTAETVRTSHLLKMLMANNHHVMLVGGPGELRAVTFVMTDLPVRPPQPACCRRIVLAQSEPPRSSPSWPPLAISSGASVRWRPHQAPHCLSTPLAGTGKTALLRDALRGLGADAWAHTTIPLNSKHDGPSLQALLEVPLEKKAGKAVARRPTSCHVVEPALHGASPPRAQLRDCDCLPRTVIGAR